MFLSLIIKEKNNEIQLKRIKTNEKRRSILFNEAIKEAIREDKYIHCGEKRKLI